jgi:hypothetical protein
MNKLIPIIIVAACLFFSACQSNSHTDASIVNDSQATVKDTSDNTKFSDALFYGSWVEPNPINEKELQGFKLNEDNTAESINMATLLYRHWWFDDNKLYLVSESKGNRKSVSDTITYDVLQATPQELHLRDRQRTIAFKKLQN